MEIVHPAGVRVPFDESAFVEFLIPEVRGDISAGSYCANLIRHLSGSVSPGDRALVIGAGLGVISSLIAKTAHADRVLAVEADPRLIPLLKRVHAMNGAGWVETANGVLSTEATGLIPFYPSRDFRDSSLLHKSRTDLPMLVPCLDLNLILTDEQINLIICSLPETPIALLAEAELDRVERILVDCSASRIASPDEAKFAAMMVERGFIVRSMDQVLLFERVEAARSDAAVSRDWDGQAYGY